MMRRYTLKQHLLFITILVATLAVLWMTGLLPVFLQTRPLISN
jgi:hypothetical protein